MTRLWYAVMAGLVAFSLVSSTILVIDRDASLLNMYSYFTIQSNILMMIAAALLVIDPRRSGTAFGIVRMAGLVAITITGIVFSTFLQGAIELEGLDRWNDTIFHYVVPAMAVVGYAVFRPRTTFARSAYLFLVWPLAWLAYTLVRAEVADPRFRGEHGSTMDVPYDFLSVDLHSTAYVAVFCLVVLALAIGIAWVYAWLSRHELTERTAQGPGTSVSRR
jgi:hypothetical protein